MMYYEISKTMWYLITVITYLIWKLLITRIQVQTTQKLFSMKVIKWKKFCNHSKGEKLQNLRFQLSIERFEIKYIIYFSETFKRGIEKQAYFKLFTSNRVIIHPNSVTPDNEKNTT